MNFLKNLVIERIAELEKMERDYRFEYLMSGNISFKGRLEKNLRAIHEVKEINKTILEAITLRERKTA
jgi:hypothetical protein